MEATAGLVGNVSPHRPFPVVIDVSSPRLLAGTLQLTAQSDLGRDLVRRSIEVAAGTTKRYVLTVAGTSAFGGESVRVDLVSDGRSVATASPPVTVDRSAELVGVLPGLARSLERTSAPLAVDVGVARLAPIPPEVLAEGPVALEVYDQIAAGSGDLVELDRASLARWVSQGGHLLLDGSGSEQLPEGFDPAPGKARVVGLGRVVLTEGALAAGQWGEVLLPTPVQSQVEEEILSSGLAANGDVVSALARDAGFDPASIGTILVVLAAYIVVVGPGAWLVVRRRRPTLLWSVVPALALATTGLLQVAGSELRGSDDAVHVTMIETGGPAMGTTSVFVAGQGGGATSLDLPRGWIMAGNPMFGFSDGQSRPRTVVADGSTVRVEPGVGGASVIRARGPVDLSGALVVHATSDVDGVLRGTVENTLEVDLDDVAVLVSRATVVPVGQLPAGASAAWETDSATRFEFGAQPEAQVWPFEADAMMFPDGGMAFDPRTRELIDPALREAEARESSSLSAYFDILSVRGSNFKPPGQAVAVGWTRDLDAPVRVAGGDISKGRTGIIGRGEVAPAGERLVDTASVRFLVRGPADSGAMGALPGAADGMLDGTATALFAFDLPGAVGGRPVDDEALALHLPVFFRRAQVWANGGWQELQPVEREVRLPGGAVLHDTVFVRVVLSVAEPPPPGRELVLYEVAS